MSLAYNIAKAMARAALKSIAFKYDWSFNKAYNFIRDIYGVAYRRSDMLRDYRNFKGRVKYQYALEHLRDDWIIPKRIIHEEELHRPYNYRIFAKVTYRHSETGQYVTKMASFYTNQRKSKSEYVDDFYSMYSEKYAGASADVWEVVNVNFLSVVHNPGMPY